MDISGTGRTGRTGGTERGRRSAAAALIALGVCLSLFAGGFFTGRNGLSAARSALAKSRAESAKRLAQAEAETQKVRDNLASQQALARLATARNLLYRSAVELERRNFGTAQTHLKQASNIIEMEEFAAAGLSSAQAQTLKDSVTAISLTVSSDTAAQRDRVLDAVEKMNRALDPLQGGDATE